MRLGVRVSLAVGAVALVATAGVAVAHVAAVGGPADPSIAQSASLTGRAALPPGAIKHVLVIDLENENYNDTFGAASPAHYLNTTLRSQGRLIENYFGTGHASLDNYIAQVSGQAPTKQTQSDCLDLSAYDPANPSSLTGAFQDLTPGTDDPNPATNPGQVDGAGCVYPAPTSTSHGAATIADQVDQKYPPNPNTHLAAWRQYAEDMGNTPARDGGTPDPTGGTDCAHPALGAADHAEVATADDQYAMRHNPFMYFHSIIDNTAECIANVVPLGTLGPDGKPAPTGHLVRDLAKESTTPSFGFITPNVCNDGHDATCTGPNSAGGHQGGLEGADLWLQHWMPLILNSPAYRSGTTMVVLTFDEAEVSVSGHSNATSCCYEQPGPNVAAPGDLSGKATTNTAPGGGQIGALVFSKYVRPGTVDSDGHYNHYSALRTYEDLLGLHAGGADGQGHLGFAAAPGLLPFGKDVFNRGERE
jgi:hypothetical protein